MSFGVSVISVLVSFDVSESFKSFYLRSNDVTSELRVGIIVFLRLMSLGASNLFVFVLMSLKILLFDLRIHRYIIEFPKISALLT